MQILCWNFCGLTNYKAISLIEVLSVIEMFRHLRLLLDSTVQYQPMFPIVRLLPDLLPRPRV